MVDLPKGVGSMSRSREVLRLASRNEAKGGVCQSSLSQ